MSVGTAPVRAGWTEAGDGAAYPPEPWHLGGELRMSVHRLPVRALPAAVAGATPAGVRLLRAGGDALAIVSFIRYTTGGVLDYDELLVAVGARAGLRPVFVIPQIWVDSPASLAGGRALWGIPKALGRFEHDERPGGERTAMTLEDGSPVAAMDAATGRTLVPGLRRVPLATAQRLEGRDAVSTNLVLGRMTALRASWDIASDGPLGWLAGRTPLMSLALLDAAIAFGVAVRRSATEPGQVAPSRTR